MYTNVQQVNKSSHQFISNIVTFNRSLYRGVVFSGFGITVCHTISGAMWSASGSLVGNCSSRIFHAPYIFIFDVKVWVRVGNNLCIMFCRTATPTWISTRPMFIKGGTWEILPTDVALEHQLVRPKQMSVLVKLGPRLLTRFVLSPRVVTRLNIWSIPREQQQI